MEKETHTPLPCPECRGNETILCSFCNGSGEGYTPDTRCNNCKGKGEFTCSECNGTGIDTTLEHLEELHEQN